MRNRSPDHGIPQTQRLRCLSALTMMIATVLIIVGLVFSGILLFGSTWFIVPKRRALEPRHHELYQKPEDFGLELEAFSVETADGITLETIIATRSGKQGLATNTKRMESTLSQQGFADLEIDETRGTVFLLHGRGGRKEDMLSIAQRFVAGRFRCVVYDARAHGKSGGNHCTFGAREIHDLAAIREAVASRLSSKGESLGSIALFGNSLGGSNAIRALAGDHPYEAVIAVAAFAELPEIVVRSGRASVHPSLPVSLIHLVMRVGGWRAGFDPFGPTPLEVVSNSETPILLCHGSKDALIPPEHGRRLHNASQASIKFFHEIPDALHYNVLAEGGDDLYAKMTEFLIRQLDPAHSPVKPSK